MNYLQYQLRHNTSVYTPSHQLLEVNNGIKALEKQTPENKKSVGGKGV